MAMLAVLHDVKDYEAWRPVFDEHGAVRKSHGCTGERVYRSGDNGLTVLIITDWPSMEAAQAFADDPSLPEAMSRAGVAGPPRLEFFEEA